MTTTRPTGRARQTVEQLPRTLLTLSLDQAQVEKVLFAQGHGELAFALLNANSKIDSRRRLLAADLFEE